MFVRHLSLGGAVVLLAFSPVLAQDSQNPLEFTNANGKTTFYGQLSPTLQSIDDGFSSKTQLMDNSSSNSRVGFNLDRNFGEAGKLRFKFETALGLRGTSSNQIGSTPFGWEWGTSDLRKLELIWTANYGVISIGQGSMATDGAATINASGTTLANSVSRPDFAGSVVFRGTDGSFSGIDVGDAFNDFDGSRRARIRYDTPSFSGFSVGAAYGKNVLSSGNDSTYYDIAARYETDLSGTNVEAALGYAWEDDPGNPTEQFLMGSVGVEFQNGFNFSVALGNQQSGGDGSYYYGNVGYAADWLTQGSTAISLDYYNGSDFETAGSSSNSWGIGVTQDFNAQNLEAYLGYIQYSYSEPGVDFADINTVMLGARWKF